MKYRTLGKTGLEVSYLSFGASSLGSVFRKVSLSEGIRAVHTALDLGINYIDVSPYYGLTTAESVLGKALEGVPRDRYYLATKVGRYGDDEFDFSPDRVVASVEESLRRMKLDYIDVIQCHDIEFGNLDYVAEETIPALRRLQKEGKVGFVGITGLPLYVFEHVLDRVDADMILSYCHYCLNDSSLEKLLPYLVDKGVGIVSASVYSMGLLTQRGAPPWHPAPLKIRQVCEKVAAFCAAEGKNLEKLALQFALRNEQIHTTLVGSASAENMKRNVAWLEEPLDLELLAEVRERLAPIRDFTWLVGRPENSKDIRGCSIQICE